MSKNGTTHYFSQFFESFTAFILTLDVSIAGANGFRWIFVGAPAGVASASLTLIFSLTTRIIKKLSSITRNKKKKHDKILMLAKSKLDNIETLVSQALTDIEISHEEFNATIREKQKCERMKENVKNISEKQENMILNSVNSKKITCLQTRHWLKIAKHFTKSKNFIYLSIYFFLFFIFLYM